MRTPVVVTRAMAERAFAATAAQAGGPEAGRFRIGDSVVYAAHGVGRIAGIGVQEIAGHALEVIEVSFPDHRLTVRVPAAKARAAGLRPLASPATKRQALAVLRAPARPSPAKVPWAKRVQEHQAKIHSGDLTRWAEVLRDLRRNASDATGSLSEREIFETALDRFAAELAALEGTSKAESVTKLIAVLTEP